MHVAPEHLKDLSVPNVYPQGSPEGDVYSFGVILYAMLNRCLPYEKAGLSLTGKLSFN